jgi:hypothetical protein
MFGVLFTCISKSNTHPNGKLDRFCVDEIRLVVAT